MEAQAIDAPATSRRLNTLTCSVCNEDQPRDGMRNRICKVCGPKGLAANYTPEGLVEVLWLLMGASGVSKEIRDRADSILQNNRLRA